MSGTTDLDLQRERAARNQSLFRLLNAQIDELRTRFGLSAEDTQQYVCECLDPGCTERIEIAHDEYQRVRRDATEFFVVRAHEDLHVEVVVDEQPRWVVVRKIGVGAAVSEQLAAGAEALAE